ncbi:MAG: hypothetical protein MJB14_15795, partial [Spirochaetes bacterium]|nr:hypothetical protein [Spirochaetota bacterium]
FCFSIIGLYPLEDSKIDWISGKIYSSVTIKVKNDVHFAHNRYTEMENAKEKAKINYYRILKKITLSQSSSLLDYIQNAGDKNRELFSLIDQAHLDNIEFPDLSTIKLTYYINLYGQENSLMNIVMGDVQLYTEKLTNYMGYNYSNDYTGVIIDARGQLTSFEGHSVKVKPAIFVSIKDNEGRLIFDKNNIYPDVIVEQGMVRYSYDINENVVDRIGSNPLTVVAYGVGDRRGSIIVVSQLNAKRMLSSPSIREAIQQGRVVIIVDP